MPILQTTSDGKNTKIKLVELKKLFNFVVDNFLFEFVYNLKQSIYTRSVLICGQQNYNLNISDRWSGIEGYTRG
jgi:hypothetical protein